MKIKIFMEDCITQKRKKEQKRRTKRPCAIKMEAAQHSKPEDLQSSKHQTMTIVSRAFLRIPEVVRTIACSGDILVWNDAERFYEVRDGQRFEEQFNALRCVRGKRKLGSIDRPFARMHIHFELIRGDKWAGTGSAFRPRAQPLRSSISGDDGMTDSFGLANEVTMNSPGPLLNCEINCEAETSSSTLNNAPPKQSRNNRANFNPANNNTTRVEVSGIKVPIVSP